MRPGKGPTGQVWALLDEWRRTQPWGGPNQTQMAEHFGISDSLLSDWKYMRSQMQSDDMARVVKVTGIPRSEWADAVAADMPAIRAHNAARRGDSGDVDAAVAIVEEAQEISATAHGAQSETA